MINPKFNPNNPLSMDYWAGPARSTKERIDVEATSEMHGPIRVKYDFPERKYRIIVELTDLVLPNEQALASVRQVMWGLVDEVLNKDFIEATARMCHEINRVMQAMNAGEELSKTWNDYDEDYKEIARRGVRKALEGSTPEEQHEAWLKDKAADGWVYGPVKDFEKKTHPCMVRYEDLDTVDKFKDMMFITVVDEMKRLYGL